MAEINNILSFLDNYVYDDADEVAKCLSDNLRKRRIEKGITRERLAQMSAVAVSNIVRFEQKGLISLTNFIKIAMALGYVSEIKNVFSEPKYSSMEELMQIRENTNKKKAYKR